MNTNNLSYDMNGQPFLVHESGMKYRPTYGTGMKSGLKCFGQVLNKPTFVVPEGLRAEIAKLPDVELRRVFDGNNAELEKFRAVTNTATNEVYAVLSDQYRVVQDREILTPFADMAEERGLNTVGRTHSQGGKTRAYVTFTNPEYIVRLLDEQDDDIMIGVRLVNSHKGDRGWGFRFFGVRMVCCNFNTWGHMLGSMHVRHVSSADAIRETYLKGIENALDKTPKLKNMAHVLSETFVKWDEAIDMAWGCNASPGVASQIGANIEVLVPEIKSKAKPTAYDIWNALTAGATWGQSFNPETLEHRADGAEKLWYANHDHLIQKGRERREKYEAILKAQQEKKSQEVKVHAN